MTKPAFYRLISVFCLLICCGGIPGFNQESAIHSAVVQNNTADRKLLLNGRIWHDKYSKVTGDPFFLTNTFLKGAVTFNGLRFGNLDLKYDIFNDELILKNESHPIIFMNKEMVDSFNLVFDNRNHKVINAGTDTSSVLKGYVNVLYEGSTALYVKYMKKIQPLGDDGKKDLFFPEQTAYIRKGKEIFEIRGKKRMMHLLEDKRDEIRYFIKSSRIKIRRKVPADLIPVLVYYDSLRKPNE